MNQSIRMRSGHSIAIREFTKFDIQIIVTNFAEANWLKPASTFEAYLQEQKLGERIVWVAFYNNEFAGYITLKWKSSYPSFKNQNIPEVMDFNILPSMRNKGIGSALLEVAEKEAAKRNYTVGLGVGLYADYGVAQKLYIKRGYIPDGLGVTYKYQCVKPGTKVDLDDDLVLWFTKKLR
ncbi:MAG: GNAT family N-acetyltransferase [Wolbachia endosymbiont of Tyrophagus putrescentiae]|nr:GNAT family N-acetyltransferase [Wolbachia endosymbiont of Tyrophagus putrescentiae]